MARRLTQILVFGPDDATGSSAIQVNGKSDLLMHLAKAPRVREEFPATVDLSLVVFGGSPWGRQTLKKRQVLHLVYDDGTRRGFRIRSVRPILARSSSGGGLPDGAFDVEVRADSILRDLADARLWRTLEPESFVTETVSLTGMAGDDVLDAILSSTWNAPSWFQAAAVQPLQVAASKPQVIGVAMSALEALDLLCERISAGGKPVWYSEPTWNSSDSKWEITLATDPLAIGAVDASNRPAYAPSGGGVSSAPNLLELSIEDESGDYFSRIMPVAGPLNTGIAKARFIASGIDTDGGLNDKTRIYFEDDALAFEQPYFIFKDNQMKGLYIAGDDLFTPQLITQTGIDDGTGKMFIDIDAELMTLPETELHFETASGSECPFIVDADRESEYGEKMAPRVAFEDVIPFTNELVRSVGASADLSEGLEDGDGNWVPTGWELVGDAVTEEETDSLFVQNGTSSVKVTADAGDGIQTGAYTFTPTDRDKVVAAMMRVITVSGRVRMTAHLTETTTSEEKVYPTGEDQIEFTALSPKEGGISFDLPVFWDEANIQFRLTALVDGTEFYVDAATITRSTDPQPYRADMGPEALFREAARYLASHGNEAPRYRARVLDKGVQDPDNFDEILLGRYVEVKAASASGSYQIDEALRVIELEYDEDRSTGRPFKDLVLSEKLPDLSDRFRTRAPIPEPDRPAPVQDPHVRTVNLLSDVSGLPGSAENRAVMVRRAVNGGPVVNALYVSDPSDTSSTADGVLVIAGADGVRWKLQESNRIDGRLFGLDTASANNLASFNAIATSDADRTFFIPAGDYTIGGRIVVNRSIRLEGEGGTRIVKSGAHNCMLIEPEEVSLGEVASATANTVTVADASFTPGAFVGHWIRITSPGDIEATVATFDSLPDPSEHSGERWIVNDEDLIYRSNGSEWLQTGPKQHYRRVIENDEDTITVEFDFGTGGHAGPGPAEGDPVTFHEMLDVVHLKNIDFVGGGKNAAGCVIRYARHVIVENCSSYGHGLSNGLSIYNSDRVEVLGSSEHGYSESGFGIFIYNSDNVIVHRVFGRDNTEEYNIQLKDCRNGSIVDCRGYRGWIGANLKCSGINPSYNCSIIGGEYWEMTSAAIKLHSLHNEATTYNAENFSVINPKIHSCGNGINVFEGQTSKIINGSIRGGTIYRVRGASLAVQASDQYVSGVTIRQGGNFGIKLGDEVTVGNGDRNVIENCILQDNNWEASGNGREIEVYGSNNIIRNCKFRKTSTSSKSVAAVTESDILGADGNVIWDCELYEDVPYTTAYQLTGETSRVISKRRGITIGEPLFEVKQGNQTFHAGLIAQESDGGSPDWIDADARLIRMAAEDKDFGVWFRNTNGGTDLNIVGKSEGYFLWLKDNALWMSLRAGQLGLNTDDPKAPIHIISSLARVLMTDSDHTNQSWSVEANGGKFWIRQMSDDGTSIAGVVEIDPGLGNTILRILTSGTSVRGNLNLTNSGVYQRNGTNGASGTTGGGDTASGGIITALGSARALKVAALTENGGAIGGTNDGDLPDLSGTPSGTDAAIITALIASVRELAAKVNAMNA